MNKPTRTENQDNPGWIWRHWHWWLLIIGLALRVALCLTVDRESAFYGWDGKEYHGYAQSLLAGHGDDYPRYFNNVRPPLYPIFLIPFVAISTKIIWHIQLAQSLLGILQAVILAKIAGRWAGQKAGDWAFVIVLLHPFLIYNAPFVMTETLFITLLWGGVLCLQYLMDGERPMKWLTASGLLLALGCLTRPTLQLFLPVAALWIGWLAWKQSNWLAALKRMVLFTTLVSVVLLPFLFRNVRLYGEFTLAPRAAQLVYAQSNSIDYLRAYEAKTKSEYYEAQNRYHARLSVNSNVTPEQWMNEVRDFQKNHRAEWWRLQWYKFRHFWTPWVNPLIFPRSQFLLSLFAVTPLFIGALVELLRRRKLDAFLVLLLGVVVVGYLVGGFLFHVAVRYRIPFVDVAFIVLTASFLGQLDFTRIFSLKPFKREAQAQAI